MPNAVTENCKACDPGDRPKKRVCQLELKESQLATANPQPLTLDAREEVSRDS